MSAWSAEDPGVSPGTETQSNNHRPPHVGPYRILGQIGKGGMGTVFLAEDLCLRRRVAIKVLRRHHRQRSTRARFLREARLAAAIDHPYACSIYEIGKTHAGRPFIVMEYIEGTSLRSRLRRGPLSVADTLRIALEVIEALQTAHEKGIVHRDLKPENIMLTNRGHAKILDFGLAESLEDAQCTAPGDDSAPTRRFDPAGTLGYMAPEQIRGEPPDCRSDVFSLGIVLHEMLTGRHPYKRRTSIETAASVLNDEPLPLKIPSDEIPRYLMNILSRMLEKDPSRRFQSMREIGEELGRLSEKDPLLKRLSRPIRFVLTGNAALIFTLVVLAAEILF